MRRTFEWLGQRVGPISCLVALCAFPMQGMAAKPRQEASRTGADVSRMVFKEVKKSPHEPSCKLTLMHVYTSKFNKKHTQFAFTASVVAKREKNKGLLLTVVGQNHELSPGGKDLKLFLLPHIELGVEDASVRRFADTKQKCKKGHVCAEYRDSKKQELQTWVSDDKRNLSLLFPLMAKQPPVVIDLSKFEPSGPEAQRPLAQFKHCTANLH